MVKPMNPKMVKDKRVIDLVEEFNTDKKINIDFESCDVNMAFFDLLGNLLNFTIENEEEVISINIKINSFGMPTLDTLDVTKKEKK